MMGGKLDVVSEPGRGSTFTARLPAAAARTAQPGAGAAGSKERSAGNGAAHLVLVAAADARTQESVVAHLAAEDRRVVSTSSAIEALQWARDLHPVAVVVDAELRDIAGWSVLAAMRNDRALAAIPVIMLTAENGRERAGVLGAAAVIVKPVSQAALADAIAACTHVRSA
jgi:CheY-like chemotaxis protein